MRSLIAGLITFNLIFLPFSTTLQAREPHDSDAAQEELPDVVLAPQVQEVIDAQDQEEQDDFDDIEEFDQLQRIRNLSKNDIQFVALLQERISHAFCHPEQTVTCKAKTANQEKIAQCILGNSYDDEEDDIIIKMGTQKQWRKAITRATVLINSRCPRPKKSLGKGSRRGFNHGLLDLVKGRHHDYSHLPDCSTDGSEDGYCHPPEESSGSSIWCMGCGICVKVVACTAIGVVALFTAGGVLYLMLKKHPHLHGGGHRNMVAIQDMFSELQSQISNTQNSVNTLSFSLGEGLMSIANAVTSINSDIRTTINIGLSQCETNIIEGVGTKIHINANHFNHIMHNENVNLLQQLGLWINGTSTTCSDGFNGIKGQMKKHWGN